MTTLAKIRIQIKRLDEQIQTLKKEFQEVVNVLTKSRPSDNKKGE